MKKTLLLHLCLFSLLIPLNSYSWGTDVFVGPQSTGRASLVATSNGTLYCSVSVGTTGVGGIKVYSSTDNGQNWTVAGMVPGLFISNTKMLVTGTDSLYCIYQVNNDLYVYSVQADVSTQFTNMQVDEWDAAASPNSNSIYLFTDDHGNNSLHRYSSIDGGYTWTGSTALVAGDGAYPRVDMSGTRLILTYYGPVLSDTTASLIKGTFYNETSPGQLATTAANFQDLVTNGLHHKQFRPVRSNGYVWFFYTEGDSTQSLNFRVSSDDGVTYSAPAVVIASPAGNADCFDACGFHDATGDGVRVAYFFKDSGVSQMSFTYAYNTTPTFSTFDPFNDFMPDCSPSPLGSPASIASIGADVGVIFQEDSSFLGTYFDRWAATVGVKNISLKKDLVIYPNPVETFLTIETDKHETLYITDSFARVLKWIEITPGKNQVDVSFLSEGIYYVRSSDKLSLKIIKT